MDFMFWTWAVLFLIGIALEIYTRKCIVVWVSPAAFSAAILAICEVDIIWQAVIFAAIYFVGLLLAHLFIIPKISLDVTVDNIIGKRCVVTEVLDNYVGSGQVKLGGQYWSARAVSDDTVYEVGERLFVVALEGVKLICKKKR